MGRRGITIGRVAVLATVALSVGVLATCDNPIDFLEQLEIAVKEANNKFLVVTLVSPSRNAFGVTPGQPIAIEFDRPVDEGTISSGTVSLTASGVGMDYVWDFDPTTKTLTVEPDPFLESDVSYTVTIRKGLKASDGGELKEEYAWSFKTKPWPAGSVVLANGDSHVGSETLVAFHITANDFAVAFKHGTSEAQMLGDLTLSPISGNVAGGTIDFATGDGKKEIWVQFLGGLGEVAEAETDDVGVDTTGPTVNLASTRVVRVGSTIPAVIAPTSVLDPVAPDSSKGSGVDDATYMWTASAGIDFTDPTLAKTSFWATDGSAHEDQYTLTLTVEDNLGNPGSDTMIVEWDTLPPTAPIFITPPTSVSPTTEQPLTWQWESTDLKGGSGKYVFAFDGEKQETEKPNFKAKEGLRDGKYSFWVFELDDVGNEGEKAYHDVILSEVLPVDGTEDIDSTLPVLFDWPDDKVGYLYDLYLTSNPGEYKDPLKEGLPTSEWLLTVGLLDPGEAYYWMYIVRTSGGETVDKSREYRFATLK